MLGVNGPADERFPVETLLDLGVKAIRVPLRFEFDLTSFFARCHGRGISTFLVFDSHPHSISDDESLWEERIRAAEARYGALVDYYQAGNEADAARDAESSWVMTHERLNRLTALTAATIPHRKLCLAAMCSGDPEWLRGIDLSPVQMISAHPYAKSPGTQPLEDLISGYLAYGKPLALTEYDSRTQGMSTFLAWDSRLAFALAFALHDDVEGFGLMNRYGSPRESYYEFQRAALSGVQHDTGGIDMAEKKFILGFKALADELGADVVGEPLDNQDYQTLKNGGEITYQFTTKGVMTYSKQANKAHFIAGR